MRLFLIAAALVAASATQAVAQGLVTQKALSLEMAQAIVQGTVEQCRTDGFSVSVSVIDGSGLLKAFVRDEGNNGPHTIDLSRRKGVHGADICVTMGDVSRGSQGLGTRVRLADAECRGHDRDWAVASRSKSATSRLAPSASAAPWAATRTKSAQRRASPRSRTY